jgi:aldose 1-epimerase
VIKHNQLIRLESPSGIRLTISTLGATWTTLELRLANGQWQHVILGWDDPTRYEINPAYIGSTVGRYANRIANARFSRTGRTYELASNTTTGHCLHGGPQGFHMRIWQVLKASKRQLILGTTSPDGDQGFPGEVAVQQTVTLEDRSVSVHTVAHTTQTCPISMTQHPYFCLDNRSDIRDHSLEINARSYLPTDLQGIPADSWTPVRQTAFDFTKSRAIRERWDHHPQQHAAGGYDHSFVLNRPSTHAEVLAARLEGADGKIAMTINTSLPAMQVYTGQYLPTEPSPGRKHIAPFAGIALEPQFLPNAPNHPEWRQPSCWFTPNRPYDHVIRYEFESA